MYMEDKEKNVTTVNNNDKMIIRIFTSLPLEKKLITQGILIGMNINQNKQVDGVV